MSGGIKRGMNFLVKYLFYLVIGKKFKQKIYLNRASGFLNAAKNKPSWYRPTNIN